MRDRLGLVINLNQSHLKHSILTEPNTTVHWDSNWQQVVEGSKGTDLSENVIHVLVLHRVLLYLVLSQT